MADGINFSKEPKGLGPQEPKMRTRKVGKADEPATTAAAPRSTARMAPAADAPAAPPALPSVPPAGPDGAPPPTETPFFAQWMSTLPLFIAIPTLPIAAIVYGIRELKRAKDGKPANKTGGGLALAAGGVVILGLLGVIGYFALQPGSSRSVDEIAVGDCILPNGISSDQVEVSSLRVIPCAEPHFGQVYADGQLSGSSVYPGDSAVFQDADAKCVAAYELSLSQLGYLKAPYYYVFTPTRTSWNNRDDRSYMCIATAETADDLFVGSVVTANAD